MLWQLLDQLFHALNRGVGRMTVFSTQRDYLAIDETVQETLQLYPMRIVAYCWLPNHWHFVLWPEEDGQLSAVLHRLTIGVSRATNTTAQVRSLSSGTVVKHLGGRQPPVRSGPQLSPIPEPPRMDA